MTMWKGKMVYTVDEACAVLRVDQVTLHGLVRRGELNACLLESCIGFAAQHLDEYRRRGPSETPGVSAA